MMRDSMCNETNRLLHIAQHIKCRILTSFWKKNKKQTHKSINEQMEGKLLLDSKNAASCEFHFNRDNICTNN